MPKSPKDWSPKPTVWVAQMESEKISWIGVGATRKEAEAALAKRWNQHAETMNNYHGVNVPDWAEGFDGTPVGEYYGVWVRKMQLGQGYLDDEDEGE
jgi:hypothetical protein